MERLQARDELIRKIRVPVAQGEVNAGGVKTAYLEAGNGEPVVLLHGAGAGAVTWHRTIGPLSRDYRVIAPDVVGYGESDKPDAAYDRPYFAAWLKDFLDELGLEQIRLVGNSQGGAISMQYALDNPDRVEKLVLVNSAALGKGMPKGALFGLFRLNNFPSPAALRWLGKYLVVDKSMMDSEYSAYTIGVAKMEGGNRVFNKGRGKAVKQIRADELSTLQVQTQIIWGEDDNFFPLAFAREAEKIMPNARLDIIAGAGHLPFMEKPGEFNETLLTFLV